MRPRAHAARGGWRRRGLRGVPASLRVRARVPRPQQPPAASNRFGPAFPCPAQAAGSAEPWREGAASGALWTLRALSPWLSAYLGRSPARFPERSRRDGGRCRDPGPRLPQTAPSPLLALRESCGELRSQATGFCLFLWVLVCFVFFF